MGESKSNAKAITIGETIKRYKFLRDDVTGDAVEELFAFAISKTTGGGCIKNDTYFHALLLTEMMFKRTSYSLRIFCGRDVATFLNTIDKAFFDCCARIFQNNGVLRIVSQVFSDTDEKTAIQQLKALADRIRNTYKNEDKDIDFKGIVVKDSETEQLNHFIACDSKMLRIEELHSPLKDSMPASNIKAKVFFDNSALAKKYEESFDADYQI